jgi:hypothetical protein
METDLDPAPDRQTLDAVSDPYPRDADPTESGIGTREPYCLLCLFLQHCGHFHTAADVQHCGQHSQQFPCLPLHHKVDVW